MTESLSSQTQSSRELTPEEARNAVLAGQVVRIVVGPDPEDPVCLHYLDRVDENGWQPMIYTESIGGWSEGVKEAVCAPGSDFYVGWVAEPAPISITLTNQEPPMRGEY